MPGRLWSGLGLSGILLSALLAPLHADISFPPRIQLASRNENSKNGVVLLVNDRPAVTLKFPAAGLTPTQRLTFAQQRLAHLLGNSRAPVTVTAYAESAHEWRIVANSQLLLAVTARDAAAQRMSVPALAHAWAQNLQRLLTQPPLALVQDQIVIPRGTARTLQVGGSAPGSVVIADDGNARITNSIFDPTRRLLTIRGLASGRSNVRLDAGTDAAASRTIVVTVEDYAAAITPHLTVRVTGLPSAPAPLVESALFSGLRQALNARPGTRMLLLHPWQTVGALRSGGARSWHVPVRVVGNDLLPVVGDPVITVANAALPPRFAAQIFYSNNPEQIRRRRALFYGQIQTFDPIRLDYHHQNSGAQIFAFHADVVNSSDRPASIHLISGIAQPYYDTIQVGRRAGAAFLQALESGAGIVLHIPPHTRISLVTQKFAPGMTVSGILQVRQLSGQPAALALRVAADDDREAAATSAAHLASAIVETNPNLSADIYGPPLITLDDTYAVGGPWSHVRMGSREALQDAASSRTLWGNYGVSYHVNLTLSNPTAARRVVGILFAPEAGLAAGVFQIDGGPILQFDPLPPPQERELARWTLAPGQTKIVHVRTLPLNGSSYPASLVTHVF